MKAAHLSPFIPLIPLIHFLWVKASLYVSKWDAFSLYGVCIYIFIWMVKQGGLTLRSEQRESWVQSTQAFIVLSTFHNNSPIPTKLDFSKLYWIVLGNWLDFPRFRAEWSITKSLYVGDSMAKKWDACSAVPWHLKTGWQVPFSTNRTTISHNQYVSKLEETEK